MIRGIGIDANRGGRIGRWKIDVACRVRNVRECYEHQSERRENARQARNDSARNASASRAA
jgi:hypothetical protein